MIYTQTKTNLLIFQNTKHGDQWEGKELELERYITK